MEKINLFACDPKYVTRLILVRHGRTNANKESRISSEKDYILDETGIDQAKKAAQRLKDFNISALYSSPILRTKQTAEYISEALGLKIEFNDDLKEYSFGSIADHTLEEVEVENKELYDKFMDWMNMGQVQTMPRVNIPGAEPMEAFEARIHHFTDEMLIRHPAQTVCAVTHMGLIKGFMAVFFGGGVQHRMNFNAYNTSLTVIDFYKQVPVLSAFNDMSHLDAPLPYGRVNMF